MNDPTAFSRPCVSITGATGFIGRALCQTFIDQGWHVIAAVRNADAWSDVKEIEVIEWSLAETTPDRLLDADALVHLACDCIRTPPGRGPEHERTSVDVVGTALLHEAWRAAHTDGHHPFIMMSSRSANAVAANQYGRIKYLCESEMNASDDVIFRPGVVFGSGNRGLYSMLKGMLTRFPIFPVIATQKTLFLTPLEDLSLEIVKAATMPLSHADGKLLSLSDDPALDFEDLLIFICQREQIKTPLLIPVPVWLLLFPVALLASFSTRFFLLKERIQGLL